MNPSRILACGLALGGILALGWIPLAPRAGAIRWIGVLLAAGVVHLVLCEVALHSSRPWTRGQVGLALLAGLAMRVALLPLPPTLSDDAYRNVWDGRVQAAGIDPYRYAPDDPALTSLRDPEVWPRINHPEYRTIYPPSALAISRLAAAVESMAPSLGAARGIPAGRGERTGAAERKGDVDPARPPGRVRAAGHPGGPGPALLPWKLSLLAIEGLGMVLLAAGLLRRGSGAAILLPAWSPLLIVETYASGHVDGAGVGLLAAAMGFWLLARPAAAAAAFVASVLVKWVAAPLAVAALRLPRRGRLVTASFVTAGVLAVPYLGSGTAAVDSLGRYQANWSFNGLVHRTLRVDAWAAVPGRIHRGEWGRLLEDGTIGEKRVGRILAVVAVMAAGVGMALRGRRPAEVALLVLFFFLLVQPAIHPWYGCWVLPLLAVSYRRSILLWTALLPLSYEVLLGWSTSGQWVESTGVQILALLPPLVLFGIESLRGGRSSSATNVSAA